MKKIRLVFLLVFVSAILLSYTTFAGVEKLQNNECEITLLIKVDGKLMTYPLTGVEIIKITPSGNLSRIVTFKIDPNDPIMDLANPVAFLRVSAKGDFYGNGTEISISDNFAVLTNSGNLKLVYHVKGKQK